jgi:hypothetical protein
MNPELIRQAAMVEPLVAISLRQPWAALIVAGLKTIEIRSWPTRRRGRVLIHAGKLPDERPEGWERLTTPQLQAAAEQRGGIVGVANLVACKGYTSARAFAADGGLHLNEPGWFAPPRLYGFVFRDIRPLDFYPCVGQTLFFKVNGFKLTDK